MKIGKNRSVKYRLSSLSKKDRTVFRRKTNVILGEKVRLSGRIVHLYEVVDMIQLLPDVRKKLVDRLHHEIQTGKYRIQSEAVAEKILSDHLFESIL